MKPALSAILVNYHSAVNTLAAIASVTSQAPDCQIVVVDNSTNPHEAERLTAALPASAKLIIAERNLGFAAACNLAWHHCDSEYILLINPDARLLPKALDELTAVLVGGTEVAAVAPTTWWDSERRWVLPTLLPETPAVWLASALARRWPFHLGHRLALRWLHWQQWLHQGCRPRWVRFLSAAVLLLRRSAVIKAGGLFDERYFMYYEDADLSHRLTAAGYRLALVPWAHAVHDWRNLSTKADLMQSSAERYVAKHYPYYKRLRSHLFLLNEQDSRLLLLEDFHTNDATNWIRFLHGAEILCISPLPQGFPAIFRPATAPGLRADESLWHRLDPGQYFLYIEHAERRNWLGFNKISP